MRIEVAIPMRDNVGLTRMLYRDLVRSREFDLLRIFDNDSRDYQSHVWFDLLGKVDDVQVLHRPGASIYRMWNEAMFELPAEGTRVAVLNNDVRVPPGFLGALSRALDAAPLHVWITYPDWQNAGIDDSPTGVLRETTGTRNLGGMCGYAYMIDVDRIRAAGVPPIDEQFEWLCGDGDLIKQVEAREGRAACVEGLWVEHLEGATSKVQAWTQDASERDVERRVRKYGG